MENRWKNNLELNGPMTHFIYKKDTEEQTVVMREGSNGLYGSVPVSVSVKKGDDYENVNLWLTVYDEEAWSKFNVLREEAVANANGRAPYCKFTIDGVVSFYNKYSDDSQYPTATPNFIVKDIFPYIAKSKNNNNSNSFGASKSFAAIPVAEDDSVYSEKPF